MTLIKRGTNDSAVVVSSSVYACSSCGHTEMVTGDKDSDKKCPKCGKDMQIVSASAEVTE